MTLPSAPGEYWVATEPELKFLPSGLGVCEFRVKAAAKRKDDNGKWVDGKTLWANAHVYSRENMPLAENTYESIKKGDDVTLNGRIYTRTYTTKDNVQKLSVDIDVDSIGPALNFRVTPHGAGKADQQGAGQAGSSSQGQGGADAQPDTSNASQGNQGSESDYPF